MIIECSDVISCTGVLFSFRDECNKGYTFAEKIAMMFEVTIDELIKQGYKKNDAGLFPYELVMPCGVKRIYDDIYFLPVVDTPCPCGNPNHWLVRWDIDA